MSVSKSQQAAVKRYSDAHYDAITVRLPKGYRDRVTQAAAAAGVSAAAYIRSALDEKMDKTPE